jgi:alpha-1,3-mannosyltransferase
MLWRRQYNWVLASIGALGLVLTVLLLTRRHAEDIRNAGVAIFKGNLPPVPDYVDRHVQASTFSEPKITHTSTYSSNEITATSEADAPQWDPAWDDKSKWPKWSRPLTNSPLNASLNSTVTNSNITSSTVTNSTVTNSTSMSRHIIDQYVRSILDFEDDETFDRLSCPSSVGSRYNQLREKANTSGQVRYFFALNMGESARVISRMMSTVVEAIRFLGPEHCAVSIVVEKSNDGTNEILAELKPRVEAIGARYSLNEVKPIARNLTDLDKEKHVAHLRNKVLEPLKVQGGGARGLMDDLAGVYSPEALIIFVDQIALCPEDILELVFQHVRQGASMACPFAWTGNGTQYEDLLVSRSLAGDTFFEIPHDGSLAYSQDLLWNDKVSQVRFNTSLPFQVFSCWGGMVTLNAASFAENTFRFQSSKPGECQMASPMLLARDMWRRGCARILAVPSINVARFDEEAIGAKALRGYVSDHVDSLQPRLKQTEYISWQKKPPGMIKCMPDLEHAKWIAPT